MSEIMVVPPLTDTSAKRQPTVYFIDDSATMREVIKIAFRRESINVVTCADAASALAQFEQNPPDAVITDVIMPDQDGYSVCTQIKQHPQFGKIPVVLMSGVVNKTVADKAVSVQADELIRKPFQPQELIGRVKALLNPKSATPAPTAIDRPMFPSSSNAPNIPNAANALNSLFAPPPAQKTQAPVSASNSSEQRVPESAWPRALAEAFTPRPTSSATPSFPPAQSTHPNQHNQPGPSPSQPQPRVIPSHDAQKLRAEVARLELLVKKLQTELQIERQYNQALETQIHDLTHTE
jgi:two-component system alkaline phosphatase synthesis response regulator PhoP